MIISASQQNIPDLDRVLFSIPISVRESYKVEQRASGLFFVISFKNAPVAEVKVLEDKALDFSFLGGVAGLHFKKIMMRSVSLDYESGLRWLVIFYTHPNYWSFIGRPEETKEESLRWVNENTMDRMAILVSFLPGSKKGEWLAVESANYLIGNWPNIVVKEEDMGAKKFRLYDKLV